MNINVISNLNRQREPNVGNLQMQNSDDHLKIEDANPQDLINYMQQLREQQDIPKDRAKAFETMENRQKNVALIQTANGKSRRWEQKLVQIKTMEGEFSVTMWASGTSDDEYSGLNDNENDSNVVSTMLISSPSQAITDEQIQNQEKDETVLQEQEQQLLFQQHQEQYFQLQQQMTGTDVEKNKKANLNCESHSNSYSVSNPGCHLVNGQCVEKQALKQKHVSERSTETVSVSVPFGSGADVIHQGKLVIICIILLLY